MIESTQNIHIKELTLLLAKNNERRKRGVFVVEGVQENFSALKNGFVPKKFFICEKYFKYDIMQDVDTQLVSPKIYDKIAYRRTTEGIIGIFQVKNADLQTFKINPDSKIIVLEGVEKPGNLGAILRSCEAFGIDAVVITDSKTDFYNPNVIRSSVGCLFAMNFFSADNQTLYDFLQKNNFKIFTTFMNQKSESIQNIDFQGNTALIFGTENSGLSDFWNTKGTNFQIPMYGKIDSLNLSNAVAICCFQSKSKFTIT